MKYQSLKRKAVLVQLIKMECTNNVDCLANKLGVSRRTVLRDIDGLKDLGAQIQFNKINNSYQFKAPFAIKESIFELL